LRTYPPRTRYIIRINIHDLYLLATLELKGERQWKMNYRPLESAAYNGGSIRWLLTFAAASNGPKDQCRKSLLNHKFLNRGNVT
jgi:hypothetical protein